MRSGTLHVCSTDGRKSAFFWTAALLFAAYFVRYLLRSQSVRDLVTEISGGATPHRCGVAQSSSSELATQAWPSQPHSRLVVPVHVGSRLAHSGSPTHPSLWRLSTVPCICVFHTHSAFILTSIMISGSPATVAAAAEIRAFLWRKHRRQDTLHYDGTGTR